MVQLVIERCTREAGVHNLERNLTALARAAAVRVVEQDHSVPLSKNVQRLASPVLDGKLAGEAEVEMEMIPMGVNKHGLSNTFRVASPFIVEVGTRCVLDSVLMKFQRYDDREITDQVGTPGVSVGLSCVASGGRVLFVEATAMVGKGNLHLTGQLGDVTKESAQIAMTWVRARSVDLKLRTTEESSLLKGRDIHINFHGAVQTRKVLAAHRYGIKRVILPKTNLKDLAEVPAEVLSDLEILRVT
ncbi:endopeptidase La [Salvia divinorum]|uniref:Endopeptidase La n=1 Tax=Salvia divinorum TaxID=28513 RepID=A0ABD1HJG8_SALDI